MSGKSTQSQIEKLVPKIKVKSSVWIPACAGNEKNVFELAKVLSINDDEKTCLVKADSGPEMTLKIDEVQLTNPRVTADMTSLYHINDAGILHNLKMRSEQDLPYTNMGSVLVAVNPLHPVPDPDLEPGKPMTCEVPHPFSIAETAFKNMTFCFERRQQHQRQLEILQRGGHDISEASEIELVVNQSVVISGESGSGKTESGKRVLHHLVKRTAMLGPETDSRLDIQLAGVGPILEAFGNASTVCNHNSSRFGKFSKLHFIQHAQDRSSGKTWHLVGATVETYLLEQSRVVNHCTGERNFHVFYELIRGADEKTRKELALPQPQDMSSLRYLKAGASTANANKGEDENKRGLGNRRPGMRGRASSSKNGDAGVLSSPHAPRHRLAQSEDEVKAKDLANFKELQKALHDIGKTSEDIHAIFETLAAILHLGNVAFELDESKSSDAAKLKADTKSSALVASKMLGVQQEDLLRLITTKRVKAGFEVIEAELDVTSAQYARDALAKWTYGILFNWLVKEINAVLMSSYKEETKLEDIPFIGVLDIFGFESFQKNGFEQLLINYTNESLQSTFNYQVFVAEADLYKREGLILDGEPFQCPSDDGDCLDLFEGIPGRSGLLMEIDSESRAPKPTDEKMNRRLHSVFEKVKSFPRPHPKDIQSTFRIQHYAGIVEYTVGDFVEKNNDRIPGEMNALMQKSTNPVVQAAFKSHSCGGSDGSGKAGRSGKKKTVVANFGAQIRNLVETLESTKCSFIRCVKPNPEMRWARGTNWFNNQYVNEQLKCLSIPQTAAVLKSGFPTRIDYDSIVAAYQSALPGDALEVWKRSNTNGNKQSGRTFVAALFWAFRVPQEAFRLGLSKVFFSSGMIDLLDRIMQEAASWAGDEGKDSEEKQEVARRFKLYYARMRWRRCVAKVIATNKFLEILATSRRNGAAARCIQRASRSYLLRKRIYKRVMKRRDAKAEAERKAKEAAEKKAKAEAEKAKQESLRNGTLTREQAASVFEAGAASRKKPGLEIDPKSSPKVISKNSNLPPLQKTPSQSGSSARQAYRSGKRLSTGWSLSGLRTPKGSINPEFLDIMDKAQSHLKKDNEQLREQNEKLHSDLESLKEDIALLKRAMPFTHILHIY